MFKLPIERREMAKIRDFGRADSSQVNALALRAWRQYKSHYPEWDAAKASIGKMASLSKTGHIFVAEREKAIVGAVAYMPPGSPRADFFKADWALIRLLVVDPVQRGQGIGRRLTDKCISLALAQKVEAIALHTSEVMEVALSMYERIGFKRVSTAPSPTSIPFGIYRLCLRDPRFSSNECD